MQLSIGNEWITAPLLMKFLEELCFSYVNNSTLYDTNISDLFNEVTLYIVPMINLDGVDLVTENLSKNSNAYLNARNISSYFPDIPFPEGWKANITGVDLKNFQPFCKVL